VDAYTMHRQSVTVLPKAKPPCVFSSPTLFTAAFQRPMGKRGKQMVRTLTRRTLARALVFAPLLLAGCISDRQDPKRADPLTGLPKRVAPGDRAVSTTYNPPDSTKSATIASSGPRPADGASGLSIRDPKNSDTASA